MAHHPSFPIVSTCARILESFLAKPRLERCNRWTAFDAARVPSISIADYLSRLAAHFSCSHACHVCALLYLDLVVQRCPGCQITAFNIHRLYLTALVVAMKFHEDFYYDNEYCATVGGIECEEMNGLEGEMLTLLEYRLTIPHCKYKRYLEAMRLYFENFVSDDSDEKKIS
eukprot:TRINITY_DN5332_c0_g3_i6.p1 TRINITY_DN5332_c0_g3~~TRINITY_DN5332_c0_g3_i6.p1  ORF type:complete len:171 (+),score=18.10 TRINITY_DN5332_c0_g3_i6:198-710(+)